tara:strand:- start:2349 stop:3530 length:1182 start_codon:yes stop_codon:yes gene_type:complete
METLATRLETAYSKLGMREPFIAAVMTKVKREVSDKVSTAATNGTWARYNPAFCDPLSNEELFGLVLHESCHVILQHMWRRDGRDSKLWNVANDAIINKYILDRSYVLPKGGVFLSWVKEEHDSAYVYNKLKQAQQEQQAKGGGSGSGDEGDEGEGGDGDDGDDEHGAGGFDGKGDLEDGDGNVSKTDMEATIATAAQMARDCGHGSAMIDRVLASVGQSTMHWQDVLRSMMTSASAADYSYRRPSRRFIAQGMYLPSLRVEALGGLAVGFDTSGSMTNDDCAKIAAEITAIVADLSPAFVEVIYCDSSVSSVQRFEPGDDIELRPTGGGGTRFQPVFDHIAESDEHYAGMVYFTDMEGNLEECIEPEFPTIWANIGYREQPAPFGTYVKVNI